jgi:hypothetical protein
MTKIKYNLITNPKNPELFRSFDTQLIIMGDEKYRNNLLDGVNDYKNNVARYGELKGPTGFDKNQIEEKKRNKIIRVMKRNFVEKRGMIFTQQTFKPKIKGKKKIFNFEYDENYKKVKQLYNKDINKYERHVNKRDSLKKYMAIDKKDLRVFEQLTSRTPEELKLIEDKYNKVTGKNLKDDIMKSFSGAVGKNLVNLWSTKRISNPNPDKNECERYANILIDNKPKDWVEKEDIFKEIFIERSPEELILIARYYLKNSGKNLLDDIDSKTGGHSRTLLKEILYNNIMPHEIFAEKVKTAVKGLGTDEEMLSRAMVSRCELDMGAMRDMYLTKYKVTMKEDIIDDTSDFYQKLLVFLSEK